MLFVLRVRLGFAIVVGYEGVFTGLQLCPQPEPLGPASSAAAGAGLPREGALASPGLPLPALLGVCKAWAVPPSGVAEGYM